MKIFFFFVILVVYIHFSLGSTCTEGDCKEDNFQYTHELERNPGCTYPLESQTEPHGIKIEYFEGNPGPMIAYGPEDAKIRVYWFSDFQCPVCTRALEPLKWLVRNSPYAKDTRLIFVNYALKSHKHAHSLAVAGLAAFKQNKFWDLLNIINAGIKPNEISTYASRIDGLNIEQFEKDRKDPRLSEQVDYESNLAREIGIRGTPGICINGVCTSGWGSYYGVENKVKSLITKINKEEIPNEFNEPLSHYAMKYLQNDEGRHFYDLMIGGSDTSIWEE